MDLAAKLPEMEDAALAVLRENAERLEQTGTSAQKAAAAQASPSIGSRMAFTGTPEGSTRDARSKCPSRSSAVTVVPEGEPLPCVGRPSVTRMMLSGRGDSLPATLKA